MPDNSRQQKKYIFGPVAKLEYIIIFIMEEYKDGNYSIYGKTA